MRKVHTLAILAAGIGLLTFSMAMAQKPGKGGGRPGGPPGGNQVPGKGGGQGQAPGGQGQGGGGGGAFGGGPGGPGGGGPSGMSRQEAMQFFPVTAVLDDDQNSEISAEEIANASTLLLKLDRNGDGILTAEELLPKGPPGGGRGRGPGPGGNGPRGNGQGGNGQ